MKKRMTSLFLALALCLGLLPVTALAAGEDAPDELYVGNQSVRNGDNTTYWTTNDSGELTQSNEEGTWNVKYDPSTATLTLKGAKISVGNATTSPPYGAGIYALCSKDQPVVLTIELIGTNTITGYYGIFLNAERGASSYGTNATLTITGEDNGSLGVSGSNHGIYVKSGTGNASINIKNVAVTSSTNGNSAAGVYVMSSTEAKVSPNLSLAVNGGSLTASGGESSDGIWFYVGSSQATGATTSLTVSENAIVDARNGGISASRISVTLPTPTPTGNNSSGIVWNGSEGTVYGDVELQEDLEIGEGESLTLDDGASLNANGHNVIVDGGKVDDGIKSSLGDSVIYKVTKVELNKTSLTLNVGDEETLIPTITPDNATNKNVTWSSDNENVATVENGKVTAVGAGEATITVTTEDGSFTAICTITVEKPYTPPPYTPPPYIPPTYAVTVPETTGGTVEVSPSRASSGRRVTITTQPAPGYELESLTVLDSRGSEIALTDQGDGKYTFTMPARKVTVQASFAPVPLPFEDVPPGAWYEEAVRYAYTHGIMEGMSDTTFVPGKSLTRAEAVQVLYNLEGQPTVSESATFPDLVYQWYKPAIAWAEQTGVVDGYEDGTFQPGDSITRQEFAQMLYNYAKYKGHDLTAEGDLSSFPDGDSVQEWALPAMSWANGNALINGHDDGPLEPGGTTTRAQAASILMRFDQKLVEN